MILATTLKIVEDRYVTKMLGIFHKMGKSLSKAGEMITGMGKYVI